MSKDDTLWQFMLGVVDSSPQLKADIINNPQAAYSLIPRLRERFGTALSVVTTNEARAYLYGYLGLSWDNIKDYV